MGAVAFGGSPRPNDVARQLAMAARHRQDHSCSMRETGRMPAAAVLRIVPGIATHAAPDSQIRVTGDVLDFPARWNRERLLAAVPMDRLSDDLRMRVTRASSGPYRAPVTTLLVGRDFAFFGVPAEIFVDFHLDVRARVPEIPILFGGYTNSVLGYIPIIKAAVDRGYGANQLGAYLPVGAGKRMIDTAVIRLGYWMGKLRCRPAAGEF